MRYIKDRRSSASLGFRCVQHYVLCWTVPSYLPYNECKALYPRMYLLPKKCYGFSALLSWLFFLDGMYSWLTDFNLSFGLKTSYNCSCWYSCGHASLVLLLVVSIASDREEFVVKTDYIVILSRDTLDAEVGRCYAGLGCTWFSYSE